MLRRALSRHCAPRSVVSASYWPGFIPDKHERKRQFHATPQREFLPVVMAVMVAVVGRYSYRAMQRMDEEWSDYQEALTEYEAKHGKQTAGTKEDAVWLPRVGIHVGYANIRVSFQDESNSKARLIETPEGHFSTPALIRFNTDGNAPTMGQVAKSKLYQTKDTINPMKCMMAAANMSTDQQLTAQYAYEALVRNVVFHALDKVMPVNIPPIKAGLMQGPLFSKEFFNVQPVITYPMAFTNEETPVLPLFVDAMSPLVGSTNNIEFISEPLAAVAAARRDNLLPSKGLVWVLDILAFGMEISLVEDGRVLYHSDCVGIGSDTLIDSVASILIEEFYHQRAETADDFASIVNDDMALQRIMTAAEECVVELSNKTRRFEVNLPYLSMYEGKPKHLQTGISLQAMEREATRLLMKEMQETLGKDVNSFTDAVTIVLTEFLTSAQINSPYQLEAVLLCGEGAKSPILKSAITQALSRLAGEAFLDQKLVVPPNVEELVVLGAAYSAK